MDDESGKEVAIFSRGTKQTPSHLAFMLFLLLNQMIRPLLSSLQTGSMIEKQRTK